MHLQFLSLLEQNQFTGNYVFDKINQENQAWRLNPSTASIGFYFRHTGEIIHLLATFLGETTPVENTTMGFEDTGQGTDVEASRELLKSGYQLLEHIIKTHEVSWWDQEVETPFFGKIPRTKLFGHILNHNAYHSGQIRLALKHPMES